MIKPWPKPSAFWRRQTLLSGAPEARSTQKAISGIAAASIALLQSAQAWTCRGRLLLFGVGCKGMNYEKIDAALDSVLRASGSALRHYTTQKTLDQMREAMRKIMSESYIAGSNDNFAAMKSSFDRSKK